MIQQSLLLILVSLIIGTQCTTDEQCRNQSNTGCQTCLSVSNCGYCKNSQLCFLYQPQNSITFPCDTTDLQFETCVGNFRVWIIVIAVIAAIIVLVVIIVICCCCRKIKGFFTRKEERRQQRDDQQMTERRAAAEVRSAERNRVADQIRMKYGILKKNEPGTDYTRMN